MALKRNLMWKRGVVALLIGTLLLATLPAMTTTVSADADFWNGESFMVEIEDGTLPLGSASSSGSTQLPEAYYGNVSINGVPAPAGTQIIATINGVQKGEFTTTVVGVYGGPGTFDPKLTVAGDEYDVGETIIFWLNGMQANQSDTYNPGTATNLDLTASTATVPVPEFSPFGLLALIGILSVVLTVATLRRRKQ